MTIKKYLIIPYGCQMNFADSEIVAGWYEGQGWKKAKTLEEADEIVIVSCSVRQTAEDRVYGQINNLTKCKVQSSKFKVNPMKIILTGCMLRYPLRYLKEKVPGVDEFRKISDYTGEPIRKKEKQALVKIMEGCNNFCSYCVVPYARGREVSRPVKDILCEVKNLAERGYKEITLLGQNVNSYNISAKRKTQNAKPQLKTKKQNTPFANLLRELHKIEGIEKISFLTSNPWDLDDDIIEAIKLPKIDRYLHLALQSGDDEILKKMNRKYSAKDYLNLVRKIRINIPDIKIGTDIIVGFPGETEEQFQNTVKLCGKIKFEKAYVSMYSKRPQTASYKMEDNVLYKEKKRRWQILNELINSGKINE